jgi:D-alanyl-lipoteichoic acid acyltransferase DltB (MBOAT superfamily)
VSFNSPSFFVFFVVVYGIYVLLGHAWQNRMLLAASLVFYGLWNWKFLGLLLFSITFDWRVTLALDRWENPAARKRLLIASLATNLGILCFFKYYNFFVDNLDSLLSHAGMDVGWLRLSLVLPVGISFYTFHMVSYVVDVYQRRLKACPSYVDYALFVTFFPQLVAGPIARAHSLLPQVQRPRRIDPDQIANGLFWIAWGLVKKIVIADGCAHVVNIVFGNDAEHAGADKLVAIYAFAIQIYGDFSGYSDMARGLAKLMGFDLLLNFDLPYIAESPSDFWRRWHISLSSWLRDYLYIPLGGNRASQPRVYFNLFVTMLLGGIWHGASWTMVTWGAYHGVLLAAYRFLGVRDTTDSPLRARWPKVLLMSQLTCLGWLLFRANGIAQVGRFLAGIATDFHAGPETLSYVTLVLPLAGALGIVEALQYKAGTLDLFDRWTATARAAFGVFVVWLVVGHFVFHQALMHGSIPFIYFQF